MCWNNILFLSPMGERMPKGQVRGRLEMGDSPLIRPLATFSPTGEKEAAVAFSF
jgi:hypothetical protein